MLFSDEITEKPQVSIPEFVPTQASYAFEKVNIKPSNPILRKRSEPYVSLFLFNYVLSK